MSDNKPTRVTGSSLVIVASLFVIFACIKLASAILVPFLLSLFLAIICNPLVKKLTSLRLPRGLAVFSVISIALLLGFTMAGFVGQSLNEFSQNLPQYEVKLRTEFTWLVSWLADFGIHLNQQLITEHFDPGAVMSLVASMLSGLGNVLANIFLIVLTVVFMLFEAPSVTGKVHLALDDPTYKLKHIDRFLDAVNSYLAIKTVVSLFTGTLVGLMLWFLNVEYFVMWALVAFLFNYIPNIGSIIAAVPAVLLAFTQGPLTAGLVAIGYMAINTVMGNVVEPRYMGKGLGLSTLIVFLSLIFWGWLLGTVGMLLSVPLTMIVKIALEANQNLKWLAVLLGNNSGLSEDNKT